MLSGLMMAACGSAPPPAAETPSEPQAAPEPASHAAAPGIGIESEVGALDEKKVKETFDRLSPKLNDCFHDGAKRVPFLAGQARFQVKVAPDGTTHAAHLLDSTLGDRTTEECMLGAFRAATWPKPVGGKEGIVENTFTFDPGDERPPVEWSSDELGKPLKHARPALSKCRAGAGKVKVTLYVEPNGRPLAIGASAADDKAEAAIPCIIDALKSLKFPSPGSYASKASFSVD